MSSNSPNAPLHRVIQGGMGIAISSWKLARTVAKRGHLGVVSGTAIDRVVACRLQEGDADGSIREAAQAFPDQSLATRVLSRWFNPEGLTQPGSYKPVPMFGISAPKSLLELTVFASFCEVWLAKRGATGPIGMNLLHKIQTPTLPVLYGALLAGVDTILMGAGIPREIPNLLDQLCRHETCAQRILVEDGPTAEIPFDPSIVEAQLESLKRPQFLAIVSSHVLAMSLARAGGVDGFVVESHIAGGHNAGPRGWKPESGETLEYGPKDEVDLARIRALGLPFWLAGGQITPESLAHAQAQGAAGIQIGTAFAFCSESGMESDLRRRAIAASQMKAASTQTEGRGSPTGYPFKTVDLIETEGGRSPSVRERQACTLGYLRTAYQKSDGSIGWRCPAEPEANYTLKGGNPTDCPGRRCLCNGLLATAGHPHAMRSGELELPLITSGTLSNIDRFLNGRDDYSANDVIDYVCPENPLS